MRDGGGRWRYGYRGAGIHGGRSRTGDGKMVREDKKRKEERDDEEREEMEKVEELF